MVDMAMGFFLPFSIDLNEFFFLSISISYVHIGLCRSDINENLSIVRSMVCPSRCHIAVAGNISQKPISIYNAGCVNDLFESPQVGGSRAYLGCVNEDLDKFLDASRGLEESVFLQKLCA